MKLKIAWVIYGSLAENTGGTIYDAKIVEGLAADHDVEVIGLRRGEDPSRIVRLRPEIIVGDELCHRELAFVFSRASARRVLLVHHLMRWEVELSSSARDRASFHEAQCLRFADLVITTSETTKKRLVSEGYRRRIEVVLPGADRLELHPTPTLSSSDAQLRFLFVGAVIPRKRVDVLIRALDGVANASLVVAGSLTRDQAYVRRVRELADHWGRRVSFLGEMDERALAIELARADALVMPSSLEGYGIAATEAIHAGTPVIATPGSMGLEEALRPCRDAVIFNADLAAAIRRFASDAALRSSMRAAAERARAVMPKWADAQRAFASLMTESRTFSGSSIGWPNRISTSTS